jgi:Concanavalin A-like lectin/glucanases superfamily
MTTRVSTGWMTARLSARPAWVLLALAAGLLPGLTSRAAAQPFGGYVVFSGTGSATTGNGYLRVPDSPALDPPSAITLEGWVQLATPFPAGGCRSLIGKDASQACWLGVCGATLRASFRGGGSQHDGGTVPAGRWTHVAVTYDGATQSHYVDGELVQSFPVSGPPAASSAPLEIGGDVSWPESPAGAVTEFRLWSVARTVDQIRATINVALSNAQPGLAAVWSLAGNGNDALGILNGTFVGAWAAVTPPALLTCATPGPGDLCLVPAFLITVSWRTGDGATGTGTVVPVASTGSGIFWFFGLENWELMVKVLNACALNQSIWVFSAATTNVFYRLQVVDVRSGVTKVYFNYPGPPAPAVTDTVAFPGSCN